MKIRINPLYSIMVLVIGCCVYIATLTSYGYLGLQEHIHNEFIFASLIMLICIFLYKVKVINFYGCGVYFCLVFVALVSELINGRSHLLNLCLMLLATPILMSFPNQCFRFLIGTCFVAQCLFFAQLGMQKFFNSYAMTTALCALECLLFVTLIRGQKLWMQLTVYFLSIALLLALGSRTALLAYAVAGLLLILGSLTHLKRNRFLAIVAFSAICIVLLWLYFDKLYEFLFSKWEIEGYSSEDQSSGRFKMWESVLKNHVSSWGHRDNFVFETYKHEDVHNIFVQVIVKYGIVTAAMFLFWCIDLIRRIIKLSGKSRIYFATVFSFFLLSGMFENVLFLDCKVFLITFVFIVNLAWLYKVSSKKGLMETAPTMFERQEK